MIRLWECGFSVLNMRTRMPFKYGIASLEALPHLFVIVKVEVDGKAAVEGLSSEGLPPKWFTKNPATHFSQDLDEMLRVITRAAQLGPEIPAHESLFSWWWEFQTLLRNWGKEQGYPSLLMSLGISLIERSMIDAVCRHYQRPFFQMLKSGGFGIDGGRCTPEWVGVDVSRYLPEKPLSAVQVRHTVGLADPILDSDIPPAEIIQDGLPQSLEANVRRYGVRYLKIKISGDLESDASRLLRIHEVQKQWADVSWHFSLDGNEQFQSIDAFADYFGRIKSIETLKSFWEGLLFIEQPVHRDHALEDACAGTLMKPDSIPPVIIDESDGDEDSLKKALSLGYRGCSFKNCKGVFKGILNYMHLKQAQAKDPRPLILSSEDLANLGPVALMQDLAVVTSLNITHSERNGHHYFKGLSMFPEVWQETALKRHPDMYSISEKGFPSLTIQNGRIRCASIHQFPFGTGFNPEDVGFEALEGWTPSSLGI